MNKPLRVWPVIHVSDMDQCLHNANIAAQCGAHGVFLISMSGDDDRLDPIAHTIAKRFPSLALGVNFLSLPAHEAVRHALAMGYAASWSDSPGVRSDELAPRAQEIQGMLSDHPRHEFFASVAFKYQKEDPNPAQAGIAASDIGFIPTTSGPATGQAPDVAKLATMANALEIKGYNRLALASGASPQNASVLAPYLSDILVSTGISSDFHTFDQALLELFMASVSRS